MRKKSLLLHLLQLPSLLHKTQLRKVFKESNSTFFTTAVIGVLVGCLPVSAPSAVPASVPVPASESAVPADKPAKSKAELKAERRARQEAERASKQGKKGEAGQQVATAKAKVQPNELQPGTASFPLSAKKEKKIVCAGRKIPFFTFSGEETSRTYPGWQPRGFKKTSQEIWKEAGGLLRVPSLKTKDL